eukprot:gene9030-1356_t
MAEVTLKEVHVGEATLKEVHPDVARTPTYNASPECPVEI